MAASAHGDTPAALPAVQAVPIEKPQPKYTPCTAPPTIPLPCDGPRITGYLSTDGSSTSTHAPTAAPPAAEGWGMPERLRQRDPDVMTTDDVLATLGI